MLVSDEPYRALVFDDVVVPEVSPLVARSIVATSWSKSLAIPGERIGYLAFSPRMPEAAELFEACTFTSRVLGFVNAPALWQWVVAEVGDQVIDVTPYREKRDLMYEGLTRIGFQCVKPQGAFYVFPGTPIDDDVAFVRLLAEEGVLTVPGSGFGVPGHIRISLTVERRAPWCARCPASSAPSARRAAAVDMAPEVVSTAEPAESIVTLAHVIYGLHAFSLVTGIITAASIVFMFLTGWPSIIAVILNYVKRGEARGTWLDVALPVADPDVLVRCGVGGAVRLLRGGHAGPRPAHRLAAARRGRALVHLSDRERLAPADRPPADVRVRSEGEQR